MANAIVGSVTLVGLATVLGVTWGMSTGVYLAEYGRGLFAVGVRFVTDLLSSVPSIVIGIFVYALVVVPMKRFSALAGALALGVMMIPLVARTTEELLRMVPVTYREAGLALGGARYRVVLSVVVRTALPGIFTGILLAMARVGGETAPLLFTALGNRFWHQGLTDPISSLPVQIFTYAISPFEEWHGHAWAGATVLVAGAVFVNVVAKLVARRLSRGSELR